MKQLSLIAASILLMMLLSPTATYSIESKSMDVIQEDNSCHATYFPNEGKLLIPCVDLIDNMGHIQRYEVVMEQILTANSPQFLLKEWTVHHDQFHGLLEEDILEEFNCHATYLPEQGILFLPCVDMIEQSGIVVELPRVTMEQLDSVLTELPNFVVMLENKADIWQSRERSSNSTVRAKQNNIVSVAYSQIGFNVNQVGKSLKKYPYGLALYLSGEAWCSEFVSWVYKVAGLPFTGGKQGGWMLTSSTKIKNWFLLNGTFITRTNSRWRTFQPNPGDYIRYNNSSGGHSGIVYYISGSTLYTVEGNVGNKVVLRSIKNWRDRVDIDGIGQR